MKTSGWKMFILVFSAITMILIVTSYVFAIQCKVHEPFESTPIDDVDIKKLLRCPKAWDDVKIDLECPYEPFDTRCYTLCNRFGLTKHRIDHGYICPGSSIVRRMAFKKAQQDDHISGLRIWCTNTDDDVPCANYEWLSPFKNPNPGQWHVIDANNVAPVNVITRNSDGDIMFSPTFSSSIDSQFDLASCKKEDYTVTPACDTPSDIKGVGWCDNKEHLTGLVFLKNTRDPGCVRKQKVYADEEEYDYSNRRYRSRVLMSNTMASTDSTSSTDQNNGSGSSSRLDPPYPFPKSCASV